MFRFVNDNMNTPPECTVGIGDTDPVTGEGITDLEFFTEYYKLADHQVYVNRKEMKDRLSLDAMVCDNGSSELDKNEDFGVPAEDPFAEDLPDEILKLREIAASLSGREADVYEALLIRYAGGQEKISVPDLARKWGVSERHIYRDREKIVKMIREKIGQRGP